MSIQRDLSIEDVTVAVILVNWHSEDFLAQALAGLDRQTVTPSQVIVVDNGSRGALPVARYTQGPVTVVTMSKNVGFAAANNRAIFDFVRSTWIALLNPDAIPEPDWLASLLEAAQENPDVASFGSLQLQVDDLTRMDGLGDIYHVSGSAWRGGHGLERISIPDTPREVFSPCAAAALYKRSVLLEVGGFDEDFFCYFEDVDLGFRLRLLGYRSLVVPRAVVRHVGGASTGGERSPFAVFHGHRNLIWCYVKNMPTRMLWKYLPQHLIFNLASIFYFSIRGMGGTILRAKWEALRKLPAMLRKRREIAMSTRAKTPVINAAMAEGWCVPYSREGRQAVRLKGLENWIRH
jgi:GT2 family glycosyltransferase